MAGTCGCKKWCVYLMLQREALLFDISADGASQDVAEVRIAIKEVLIHTRALQEYRERDYGTLS